MEHLLNDVRAAVRAEAWYSALALTLALPDICGFVEAPGKGSRARCADWFNREVAPRYRRIGGPEQLLSGDDCYALRCAFLHQGEFEIMSQSARDVLERFQFVVPLAGSMVHNNRNKNKLQLQVSVFCEDVCAGVEAWLGRVRNQPVLAQRLASLAAIEVMQKTGEALRGPFVI